MKDPYSGNLDRIQIIKGWLDDDGEAHEQVYDVAWSGDRQPGPDGKLPSLGTTQLMSTTPPGAIQSDPPSYCPSGPDPEFDPDQHAFYYAARD